MSQQLISHNSDLKQLRDEGYEVEISQSRNYLIVRNIPYVNPDKEIQYGDLVSAISLAGDKTIKPKTHVAFFIGNYPCDQSGKKLMQIYHSNDTKELDKDLIVNHSFSSKPSDGYKDYFEKMSTYASIISGPAHAIDPTVTPRSFKVIETKDGESVFKYIDTASSRAGINTISQKLELEKVGIIGLGGTGSYVLDLIAKTLVKEIVLIDGDKFSQHNAFRSPGAPSVEDLRDEIKKVDHFRKIYSNMHDNITAVGYFLNDDNLQLLEGMDFVFICIDGGEVKKTIVEKLEELDIPFIDTGMGIQEVDSSLLGILRVTTSTKEKRKHVWDNKRINFSESDINDEYTSNIQIADLNMLNAALAVIKFKKIFGFYTDYDKEHHCTYTIDGNALNNEEGECPKN